MERAVAYRIVRLGRGASTTELALMLPILTAFLFWDAYFWDISRKRIKALEAARYAAWETAAYRGAFGKTASAVAKDTKQRYADLDGSTPDVVPEDNKVDFNKLTIDAVVTKVDSVEEASSGASGGLGEVSNAVGATLKPIFSSLVGPSRMQTQVEATVTFNVTNDILPTRLHQGVIHDPLKFKATNVLVYDTWDAWQPGDNPASSQSIVKGRIKNALIRSQGVCAFPGIGAILGKGSLIGGVASGLLGLLGMPWAFEITDDKVQVKPRTLGNDITAGIVSPTSAGMPGVLYEGVYWTGDGVGIRGTSSASPYSGLLDDADHYYHADWNRHSRAANCRGAYYDGSRTAQAEYYDYLIDDANGCSEPAVGYTDTEAGTRRGLARNGFQIEDP
jgi:hypothetical protein